MSKSLAVKYRPTEWEDVCDQKSIIKVLQQELVTNNIKNCYLFCGISGAGKTTMARLLANKINKNVGEPIEIDAASNNGVDNVREIIKGAQERSLSGEYKIYIIDETHALSNQAWQALLKLIEEPPQYTIFIFCTTDPQKIPATILNRVERFNFTRISTESIISRLAYICEQEHFTNYEQTIRYIAKIANGGMRDAIAILDKCGSFSTDLSIENIVDIIGMYSYDSLFSLLNAFIDDDEKKIFEIINMYYDKGNDLKTFIDQLLSFVLDVCKYAIFKSCDLLTIPAVFEEELKHTTAIDNPVNYLMYISDKLLELKNTIRFESNIKSVIEITFMQIARCK